MRKIKFFDGGCYHVFNRGTDKRDIFLDKKDYDRFIFIMRHLNTPDAIVSVRDLKQKLSFGNSRSLASDPSNKIVDIICYCLNPNHFHFILRQLKEGGISGFMQKIGTSYTKYFNTRNDRSGSLFQGPFKAVQIDSDEQLLYLSTYVNANHFIHGYENIEKLSFMNSKSLASDVWPYCSFPDYLGKRSGTLCQKEAVLDQFENVKEYARFIQENAAHFKEKERICQIYAGRKLSLGYSKVQQLLEFFQMAFLC